MSINITLRDVTKAIEFEVRKWPYFSGFRSARIEDPARCAGVFASPSKLSCHNPPGGFAPTWNAMVAISDATTIKVLRFFLSQSYSSCLARLLLFGWDFDGVLVFFFFFFFFPSSPALIADARPSNSMISLSLSSPLICGKISNAVRPYAFKAFTSIEVLVIKIFMACKFKAIARNVLNKIT